MRVFRIVFILIDAIIKWLANSASILFGNIKRATKVGHCSWKCMRNTINNYILFGKLFVKYQRSFKWPQTSYPFQNLFRRKKGIMFQIFDKHAYPGRKSRRLVHSDTSDIDQFLLTSLSLFLVGSSKTRKREVFDKRS